MVSDSPPESRAEELARIVENRARLEEDRQRAEEALGKARQSGSREELAAAERALGRLDAHIAASVAAEILLRPPTGEAPAHE